MEHGKQNGSRSRSVCIVNYLRRQFCTHNSLWFMLRPWFPSLGEKGSSSDVARLVPEDGNPLGLLKVEGLSLKKGRQKFTTVWNLCDHVVYGRNLASRKWQFFFLYYVKKIRSLWTTWSHILMLNTFLLPFLCCGGKELSIECLFETFVYDLKM